MKHERNLWVIGGDMRQIKLAEQLCEDGHTVHTYALEQGLEPGLVTAETSLSGAALADCIILPLPTVGEKGYLNAPLSAASPPLMETVLAALRPKQVVCCGKADEALIAQAQSHGLRLYDYFIREELVVANAVPTVLAGKPRENGATGGLNWRRARV